jgi:hypothetical protein
MENSIKVVTIKAERDSAKCLGYDVSTVLPHNNNDLIIRWGNSSLACYSDSRGATYWGDYSKVINPSSAIRLNCYKSLALKKMSSVINIPAMWGPDEYVPEDKLVVYRTEQHSGGKGFNVKRGPFCVKEGYYATEYLPTDTEYRVWFCGNRTMYSPRVKYTKEQLSTNEKYPCRSMWGYKNYFQENPVPTDLHIKVLAAARQIGLEVGGADVLLYKGIYYILELNSAITIDTKSIENFYKQGLKELISLKYPGLKQ